MAYIIVPSRRGWTRQPIGSLELDSDALAVILPSTGSRYGASPEGVPLSSTNRIVTEHGVALGRTTGGWGLGQRYFSGCAPSDDVTLLTVAWSKSASVSSRWPASVAQFANALSYGIEFGTGTAATVRLRAYLAGGTRYVGGNIPIPTVPTTIVARHKYGEQTLWVGGEKDSNEGTFNGPGSGFAYIGAYSGAAFDYVLMTAFWKRAISDGEIRRYTDNPWQIFRPRRRVTFFDLGAGGGSTLNALASGQSQASGTAQLAAQVALAGIGVAVAGGQANAAVAVPLAAAGIAVAGGQANARATVAITAAGLAQAAGQAGLSAAVLAQAAGAAQAAGNAQLAAQLQALASGAAQASGAANLSGGAPGVLSAAGTAEASGAAVLTVTVNLAATGNAQAGGAAAGQLLAAGSLAAFGQAVAGGAAWPSLQVNLAASGGAQSGGQASATLSAADQITAIGSAQASGQATLSITATLTAAGFALAMGAGGLSIEIPLAAFGTAQAGGSAGLVDVPDYIPVAPLRLAAGCQRPATLRAPALRTIHLRHEATRAH